MRSHEDARAWDARLGWAHGLIADDPQVRSAALDRLAGARKDVDDAVDRLNAVWRRRLPVGRAKANRGYDRAAMRSLPNGLWNRPAGGHVTAWPGLPYALLFLEWEARYPLEWTRHAKHWGTKQQLIRDLAVAGHAEPVREKLTDLTEIVVRRPHRCKDREYVRVARAVDGDDLRDRLGAAARSDDPWACRHAGYVLWLLDHPEVPNTRHVWRTWLDTAPVADRSDAGTDSHAPDPDVPDSVSDTAC
ncbi:hypothetical protein [Streptomyces fructofermentans]|uniref:hypothetical protein n=1 Tax=Streptomyces fructofermentans TaxID=152141 RepID=UPI00379A2D30